MSLPVLIGFAGVLVAAVVTGLLAGRAVRQPGLDAIVWTAATLALTVGLVAQSMGLASGFGSATFRAVQLFALLLAPLWLAWGLAEMVGPGGAARFGTRLACGALSVVGSVILATDPLTGAPFGKGWPLASEHYQAPWYDALDVVQAVAVLLAVASIGLVAVRARTGGSWPGSLPGAGLVGLAVFLTVGLRFSLPARLAYPLLSLLAAALVWFGVTRLEAQPGRDRGTGRHGTAARDQTGSDRMADRDQMGRDRGGPDRRAPYPPDGYDRRAPDGYDRRAPYPPDGYDRRAPYPANGYDRREAPHPAAPAPAAAPPPPAPAPPYGRILIFTLLDDRAADFDRFAEQAAEEVSTREPDTLVYVIHLVPNAPMQRIFYEIYRDQAALASHERQPYVMRFAADRRSCVLATNVIELRLKYAKIAPLPGPPRRTQVPQALEPLPLRPDRPRPYAERGYGGS